MSDEERVEYSVKGQFDLSSVELETDVPLRVAAVRDGAILASETLGPKKRLSYDLSFHLPFPCGFRIVLGRAEVPDSVFLSTELAAQWVSPRSAKTGGNPKLAFELEPIAIEATRYKLWLLWCRRYRIRGRVVCRNWHWNGHHFVLCDDPVPGATVEINDVDCLWWFCRRDLITTATTAPDGTFEAEFWWCCGPWRPWYPLPWDLDLDLLERIRRLVEEVRPVLPIPIPDRRPIPYSCGSSSTRSAPRCSSPGRRGRWSPPGKPPRWPRPRSRDACLRTTSSRVASGRGGRGATAALT